MKKDIYLRKVANQTVIYQISTIVCFFVISIVFQMNEVAIMLFITMFFAYSFYILVILVFQENLCPNCGEHFFKKKNSFSNLGFSFYTKKCTNCGYKLDIDKK
ncbi:hypothetical protein A7456_07000 [Moraxella nonliquefaciens]|jgi:hypothetical protein|uniref:Uncharacterized protein n=1 Tax=Moraxella nonliquefaciens TaxID=478 RepID=A0A1B8QH47_MORNO|nr:hypothetical protein A7456_07000 [Moraxella nonliquefaciens]